MTFSIVVRCGQAYGVAVASKFLSVGAVVPGARPGVGAVATQSFARIGYIDECLSAMAEGRSAQEALDGALRADEGRETRQVGVVGAEDAATFTGSECMDWHGGVARAGEGDAYAIQGNILAGPEVVADMEAAWLASAGQPVARRLVAALLAGDAAGGDARGRQSAALYVIEPGAGYDACGVRADLRVDDHPEAPRELARLLDLHELYFGAPEGVQALTGDLAAEVRERLGVLGYQGADLVKDLEDWAGEVNLETRLTADGIDARVLEELRRATPLD